MKDVKNELEVALDSLAGKGKGAKGKAPRGADRKKMWEEVRALRKEYVLSLCSLIPGVFNPVCLTGTDSVKQAWSNLWLVNPKLYLRLVILLVVTNFETKCLM